MRTPIKRLVIWLYCHGWISEDATERLFQAFRLTEA